MGCKESLGEGATNEEVEFWMEEYQSAVAGICWAQQERIRGSVWYASGVKWKRNFEGVLNMTSDSELGDLANVRQRS